MKLVLLLCCLILFCEAIVNLNSKVKQGPQRKIFTKGVEFNQISRSTLLKILSAFEESFHKNLRKKKLKPVFTAQFANNRFTRPFIYPNVFQTAKGEIHPY